MKIWHDDLGLQDDQHEMKVLWIPDNCRLPPVEANVTGGDTAACFLIVDREQTFGRWYSTVRDLLLAGF